MWKPTFLFPTWFDTNQAVQLQKMARCLKFRIKEVEGLNYPCSKNKGADQLRGTAKLICAFVFAYAKCWFNGALLTVYLYMLYPIATFQKAGTCLDDHQSMAKQQHGETANQKLCE